MPPVVAGKDTAAKIEPKYESQKELQKNPSKPSLKEAAKIYGGSVKELNYRSSSKKKLTASVELDTAESIVSLTPEKTQISSDAATSDNQEVTVLIESESGSSEILAFIESAISDNQEVPELIELEQPSSSIQDFIPSDQAHIVENIEHFPDLVSSPKPLAKDSKKSDGVLSSLKNLFRKSETIRAQIDEQEPAKKQESHIEKKNDLKASQQNLVDSIVTSAVKEDAVGRKTLETDPFAPPPPNPFDPITSTETNIARKKSTEGINTTLKKEQYSTSSLGAKKESEGSSNNLKKSQSSWNKEGSNNSIYKKDLDPVELPTLPALTPLADNPQPNQESVHSYDRSHPSKNIAKVLQLNDSTVGRTRSLKGSIGKKVMREITEIEDAGEIGTSPKVSVGQRQTSRRTHLAEEL